VSGLRPLRYSFVVPALIALIGVIAAAVLQLLGQLASARNDRALAHQEVDLLQKLQARQPRSQAATDLEVIVSRRIRKWGVSSGFRAGCALLPHTRH
jgi:hypothetical protein